MKRWLLLALAGCHHGAATPTPPVENQTPAADGVFLDAATLLANGPGETTPRATIDRYGEASLTYDGPRESSGDPQPGDEIMPVSETRETRVRVLHDAGTLRLLVWVDRDELATVVAVATGVAPGPTAGLASAGGVGVRLMPGTRLATITDAQDPARRAVTVTEDDLRVEGEILAAALGPIWVPIEAGYGDASIGENVEIRAAPDRAAAVLATVVWAQMVTAVSSGNGWTLIETTGPHVIARGYVPDDQIGGGLLAGMMGHRAATMGTPGGATITVPAGACLYDGRDGALTGVMVETQQMNHDDLGDGWHEIEANTFYGNFAVTVRDAGDGAFAMCADPEEETW